MSRLDPTANRVVLRPRFFDRERDIGRGQTAKFARFELRDTSGTLVFRYRTLYDKKSRAKLDGDMKLLADFVQRS